MAFVMRLGGLSVVLRIAWAVWVAAGVALIVWRQRGRTARVFETATPALHDAAAAQPRSKRRWRLRAAGESIGLQLS